LEEGNGPTKELCVDCDYGGSDPDGDEDSGEDSGCLEGGGFEGEDDGEGEAYE